MCISPIFFYVIIVYCSIMVAFQCVVALCRAYLPRDSSIYAGTVDPAL